MPGASVASFVRHYWFVRWQVPPGHVHFQPVLPLPAVNLVLQDDALTIYGPATRRTQSTLSGQGAAFGVLFAAAGFSRFTAEPIHLWVDRSFALDAHVSADCTELRRLVAQCIVDDGRDPEIVPAFDALLGSMPVVREDGISVQRWVDHAEAQADLVRVETWASEMGVSLRTLQRGLRECVGLGPKALLRRYRLLEAAGRLVRSEHVDLTTLALQLGYTDQAHFTRDFRAVVGRTPGSYADQSRSG
jgi:AraC-like DNA-binding protein